MAPLSPMMREMYTTVSNYKRIGQWTLDATETAQKYFLPGMSKSEALEIMKNEECELTLYPTSRPEISCYRRIKGAFMGIRLPFFNTYKIVVILEIDGDKVQKVDSVINLETIFG